MISNSTDKKAVNTLVKHEGLLSAIIQWGFWDEHRPDLVNKLSVEKCVDIAVLGTAITGELVGSAVSSSAEDRQLLGSIGSIPIVSKDYYPNCIISFVVGLIRDVKKEGILSSEAVLQPLMVEGDCIDKDVIMEMIDLGMNYVHNYAGAVVVAGLSAVMLRDGRNDKPSDIRVAFAIRHGLVEMCLGFMEQYHSHMCEENTAKSIQCQCLTALSHSFIVFGIF